MVGCKKLLKYAQETSPSYITTTPETGSPIDYRIEEYEFPRYVPSTPKDVNLSSLIYNMASDVLEKLSKAPPQKAFDDTLENVKAADEYFEFRRKVLQLLPRELQEIINL